MDFAEIGKPIYTFSVNLYSFSHFAKRTGASASINNALLRFNVKIAAREKKRF